VAGLERVGVDSPGVSLERPRGLARGELLVDRQRVGPAPQGAEDLGVVTQDLGSDGAVATMYPMALPQGFLAPSINLECLDDELYDLPILGCAKPPPRPGS